jgi:hypothetical protein
MGFLASSLARDLRKIAEAAAKYPGTTVRLEPFGLVVEATRTADDGCGSAARQVVSWEEVEKMHYLSDIVCDRIRFMHAVVLQQTSCL